MSYAPAVRAALLAMALAISAASTGFAQAASWNSQQVEMSRVRLDSLLVRFDQTAQSSAYSGALREQARREAALIRVRLEEGDFRVGDQIALTVEGETDLSQNFIVQAGPALQLPRIGTISVRGILRSELEEHMRAQLGRYIRNPIVQARSTIRLFVNGAVGEPGYKSFATTTVFSDILSASGGLGAGAQIERIRVERSNRVIWEGDALQQAIIEGRTLDQMSIQAGDVVLVPLQESRRNFLNSTMGMVSTVGSIIVLIGTLSQLF